MEKDSQIGRESVITKDNLHYFLSDIAIQRERKGTSEVLIPHIQTVLLEAEKLGEKSAVLQLYQEEFLSAQHMVMEERSKRFRINPIRAAEGFLFMEISSQAMESYAEANSEDLDPAVKARVFRFLGRYMDYKGYFKKSEKYYRKGLEYFDRSENPEEKINRLEFSGLLSYSLIKQGRIDKGIGLAEQTLRDFDESEEGLWLKDNNYYTWAVWKSGIEMRTAENILRKKDAQHIGLAKVFLADSENILKMPDGSTENFRLRLDELDVVKYLMEKSKL